MYKMIHNSYQNCKRKGFESPPYKIPPDSAKILRCLDPSKEADPDKLPTRYLKLIANENIPSVASSS